MSLEQSLTAALVVEVAQIASAYPGDLSATEAQVLRLLARGRTTKEIAAELVVATSTTDRHITHSYDKLGVRDRAEAQVWRYLRQFPHPFRVLKVVGCFALGAQHIPP